MNAAKMPQLRSQLPERSRRKKNSTRRTHVAECRPSDAEAPQIVAICHQNVTECRRMPQPAQLCLCRLGPTADRPRKITFIKNFAGPDHSQKIPVFSPPHCSTTPQVNFANPFRQDTDPFPCPYTYLPPRPYAHKPTRGPMPLCPQAKKFHAPLCPPRSILLIHMPRIQILFAPYAHKPHAHAHKPRGPMPLCPQAYAPMPTQPLCHHAPMPPPYAPPHMPRPTGPQAQRPIHTHRSNRHDLQRSHHRHHARAL